jgi:hypothetical protein
MCCPGPTLSCGTAPKENGHADPSPKGNGHAPPAENGHAAHDDDNSKKLADGSGLIKENGHAGPQENGHAQNGSDAGVLTFSTCALSSPHSVKCGGTT